MVLTLWCIEGDFPTFALYQRDHTLNIVFTMNFFHEIAMFLISREGGQAWVAEGLVELSNIDLADGHVGGSNVCSNGLKHNEHLSALHSCVHV